MNTTPEGERLLGELDAALADERRALLGHDLEAVLASTRRKQELLGQAARLDPRSLGIGAAERLARLAEDNRANGALLQQRRRAVGWALRQLGRIDQPSGYTPRGLVPQQHLGRSIGHG